MAIYWIGEVIPLSVTSFLPLIIFPMSGIMTGTEVSSAFFKDSSWLFVGGLLIAIAVEVTGLHKRTAIRILIIVGAKPRSLMFGFMTITFFLSMWISTTATTAMMLPIVEAVFNELKADAEKGFLKAREKLTSTSSEHKEKEIPEAPRSTSFYDNVAFEVNVDEPSSSDNSSTEGYEKEHSEIEIVSDFDLYERSERKRMANLIKGVTLCVPFASTIGGTATLTGTAPNLVLAGQYELFFPDADVKLTFGNWIIYALPGAIVTLIITYIWLCWYFFGFNIRDLAHFLEENPRNRRRRKPARDVIAAEYVKLGSIKWGEVTVLVIFVMTTLLWFFREPGFMPGWAVIFPKGYVTDGTVAVAMSFLLFILPSKKPSLFEKRDTSAIKKPVPPVLDWKSVHKMFPWDILFLFAGGYALADGATKSGFSQWMGELLAFDDSIQPWLISLVCTIIVCLFTQVSNNTATSSIFAPILAQLAITLKIHPIYLMLPPVLASSMAFMLPVSTPSNAIAFSYGHLKVIDLIKTGWFLNIAGVLVLVVFINTYGVALFGLNEFPAWAGEGVVATTLSTLNQTFATPCVPV
uniref:Sulfate transporter n=1 Tax=Ascidia sydneiensis samea TaxID=79730 RepID=B9X0K8_ASCSS|nr:sulfate transporter [Ascidia sydneiensis samea]